MVTHARNTANEDTLLAIKRRDALHHLGSYKDLVCFIMSASSDKLELISWPKYL